MPEKPRLDSLSPAVLLFLLTVAACSDPVRPRPTPAEVAIQGRPERGFPIALHAVTPAGDTLPSVGVEWSLEPAFAGTLIGDTLWPAEAGQMRVTANYVGGRSTRLIDVVVPPAIVFDMIVAGNRDVFSAALDGGDLVRLTSGAGADYDPTVAGARVVFVSDRDGNAELYSMPLAGGAEQRLTTTAASEMHPALSPDGERLAFVRGSGLTRVYVAAADASAAVRPDPSHGNDGTLENAPAWSPDGQALAFVSTAGGNPDLYRWTGGAATWLDGESEGDFEPAWSRDGRHIAFSSTRSGEPELYLLNLNDGKSSRLTDRAGSDGYPVWLADGRIVYVAYVGTTRTLRWLDPADPSRTYEIPLPGEPGNPAAARQEFVNARR